MNMRKLLESIDRLSIVETTNVTDFNPPSQGKTRKELLAKFKKTKDPKDGEKARKAGATQKELQDARQSVAEGRMESNEQSKKIEAYGVHGMNSKQWHKIFKNQEAFEKWLEKNDGNVEVYGTRDVEQGVAEGGYPEVDHMPGKRGIGLDRAKPKDTYVKTFHASKEKEAREFAKKHGYTVKKHVYPKSANNTQPHEFQVHKNGQGVAEGLGKNIKRAVAGWGAFDKDKPADVVKRVRGQHTDTLKGLSRTGPTGKGSPAELQQKAISRELKKRGGQGVAEGSEFEDAYGQGYSDGYDGKRYNNPFPVGSDHDEYEDGYGSSRLDYNKMNRDLDEQSVAEAGNKPLEKSRIGTGDTRTPRELKTQMKGASDEFVKSTADKKTGPFHSTVAKMQGKLAKSELRRREQGVAEGKDTEVLANEVYVEFERVYPQLARRADERTVHAAIMDVLNYGGDNNPAALAQDVARAVKRRKQGVAEGPDKCWPNHRKVGTQPGTGKNTGKRVNDCEKIKK